MKAMRERANEGDQEIWNKEGDGEARRDGSRKGEERGENGKEGDAGTEGWMKDERGERKRKKAGRREKGRFRCIGRETLKKG